MEVRLQQTRTNYPGFNHLSHLYSQCQELAFTSVHFDFTACSWFDANMAAPLGAVITKISDELNSVELTNIPEPIRNILRKNEFLQQYGDTALPDQYGTTMPYRRVDLQDERYFASYLSRHTSGKGIPRMTPALTKRFYESIGELYSNAVLHSRSKLGVFACGQYYPRKDRFDFCLTDAGEGFEGSILRAFGVKVDSIKAMRFCLTEGNTTKKNEPGGLGLKLLQKFIRLNNGRIVIVSKNAYYEYSGGKEGYSRLESPFPGTCINVEINTADTTCYQLSNETPPRPPRTS